VRLLLLLSKFAPFFSEVLTAAQLYHSTIPQVPCHSIVATPLLVAFELLLCVYLEGINGEPFVHWELS
jgi:hypothetical protein